MKTRSPMKRVSQDGTLYRLIYCSRNVILQNDPGADLEKELQAILAVARKRNKAANVTGALLFTTSGFAQVLEGPRDVVERAFERIAGDPRHADVMVLNFAPAEKRSFPDWSMGCSGTLRPGDPLDCLAGDPAAAIPLGGRPRATTGTDVLRLLERVVRPGDEWLAAS